MLTWPAGVPWCCQVEPVDVAEARRLLEVAMQQSATDPETGFIDMDVINTGISASERTKRDQIRQAVVELLQTRLQGSRGTMKLLAVRGWEGLGWEEGEGMGSDGWVCVRGWLWWWQVFEEMKQQTHLSISIQQVRSGGSEGGGVCQCCAVRVW